MAAGGYSTRAASAILQSRPLKNVTTIHDIFVPNESVSDFVSANELNPKLGCIIQYNCETYYHWALYIGDGNILHLLCDGIVHKDPINYDPQINWLCRVNNKVERARDLHLEMLEFGVTMSLAYGDLGKYIGYDRDFNNCEHRVMCWKYGYSFSDQVKACVYIGKPIGQGFSGFNKGVIGGAILGSAVGLKIGSPASFACGGAIACGVSVGYSAYVKERRRQNAFRETMEDAHVNRVLDEQFD